MWSYRNLRSARHEIADILAVSWKEKHQELYKLRQARQFHKEADLKKTYRIEVEELKRKRHYHRYKKIGHWAKECKMSRGIAQKSAPNVSSTHAAGYIQTMPPEHFVCALPLCWIVSKLISLSCAPRNQRSHHIDVFIGLCNLGLRLRQDHCESSDLDGLPKVKTLVFLSLNFLLRRTCSGLGMVPVSRSIWPSVVTLSVSP